MKTNLANIFLWNKQFPIPQRLRAQKKGQVFLVLKDVRIITFARPARWAPLDSMYARYLLNSRNSSMEGLKVMILQLGFKGLSTSATSMMAGAVSAEEMMQSSALNYYCVLKVGGHFSQITCKHPTPRRNSSLLVLPFPLPPIRKTSSSFPRLLEKEPASSHSSFQVPIPGKYWPDCIAYLLNILRSKNEFSNFASLQNVLFLCTSSETDSLIHTPA